MLAPLVVVLVWADLKLSICGRGGTISGGPSNEWISARTLPTGIRLTAVQRAPYSIRTALVKALLARTR
jgi:hypothetical protein